MNVFAANVPWMRRVLTVMLTELSVGRGDTTGVQERHRKEVDREPWGYHCGEIVPPHRSIPPRWKSKELKAGHHAAKHGKTIKFGKHLRYKINPRVLILPQRCQGEKGGSPFPAPAPDKPVLGLLNRTKGRQCLISGPLGVRPDRWIAERLNSSVHFVSTP